MERELGYLGTAIQTQGNFSRYAPANVHDRGWVLEYPGGVPDPVPAGRNDRSDQGKSDLATVQMAGQEQIHFVALRPG